MSSRSVRLAIAACCVVVGVWLLFEERRTQPPAAAAPFSTPSTSTYVAPTATPLVPVQPSGKRVPYYISIHELDGLPLDLPAWSPIEIWAAWDPPLTESPFVEKLLTDVYVESVLAPVTPEDPVTVLLSVRKGDLDLMIYGDRYAALHAVVQPRS